MRALQFTHIRQPALTICAFVTTQAYRLYEVAHKNTHNSSGAFGHMTNLPPFYDPVGSRLHSIVPQVQ